MREINGKTIDNSDYDLPSTGNLKRTGLKGELLTDEARKTEIAKENKKIKESQPAGLLKKWVNTDRILSTPANTKSFKNTEREKAAQIPKSQARLKELNTRRK